MTDSSDDSADTVISVLDSRPSQSLSTSDSLSAEDSPSAPQTPENENSQKSDVMGNRQGGEKKKKKDDTPQEKKPEDKPKKKGKKSKGRSKRNSHNAEGDVSSGQGACASPSSSATKDKPRSRSKRPDVLADLGAHAPGSPLGSPESASGSQGTWSYDDESDVSTLGYSTPLLSTPQVQRYVLPKQTIPQQSSSERLEELGRSIERNIIDKLSDKPVEEGATAAVQKRTSTDRKEKRNVKKKRALGQAVIDSDSFTLPLQDVKTVQAESRSPQAQRLNVGTEKISLRASQESPISPWLRDDDTPVDEEQMDEMFISCIDLSYNLADICSEKEFTEYGSLDSKKHGKSEKNRTKETSLSPRIARKPNGGNVSPWAKESSKVKVADTRDTPPKSDSSTSTLAEAGRDSLQEVCDIDTRTRSPLGETSYKQEESKDITPPAATTECADSPSLTTETQNDAVKTQKQPNVKQKTEKSISKTKAKKKQKQKILTAPIASKESDIPMEPESLDPTTSGDTQQCDPGVSDNVQKNKVDSDVKVEKQDENHDDHKENVADMSKTSNSEIIPENLTQDRDKVLGGSDSVKDVLDNNVTKDVGLVQNNCVNPVQETQHHDETDPNDHYSEVDHTVKEINVKVDAELRKDTELSADVIKQDQPENVPKPSESLSPPESASPKHVPPPSPSAMDALAEIDEDDEEALEALEDNSQLKEVQLFGETVFKRLSSLVESQSQDEDTEERFKDFRESDDIQQGCTDSPPVNLGSMALLNGDVSENCDPKTVETFEGDDKKVNYQVVMEEEIVAASNSAVDKSIVEGLPEQREDSSQFSNKDAYEDKDGEIVDDGTLKRKKKKSGQKKAKKDQDKSKKDPQGNVVKRPEIPAELKQLENTDCAKVTKPISDANSEGENTPPKRESQQIQEVIDAYVLGDVVNVNVEKIPSEQVKQSDYLAVRPRYESDDEEEDDDSDSSSSSRSRSTGRPCTTSLELSSRHIPDIEETFSELLSVKHILEDLEDRTPTDERLPSFVSSDELRSPPECLNGRRSRMSPAITDRTESDLDISEQRDDISTDSMYADDEDDGASEVLFSRSYSEPTGNEVVVSCTFYNTQHNNSNNNNATDSDDFWEDYTTADESFKQIEISADAASSTFQNARKQMHDIHQHLQDLRRQMEYLQEEVESATLTPEYSMDSEDKRHITE